MSVGHTTTPRGIPLNEPPEDEFRGLRFGRHLRTFADKLQHSLKKDPALFDLPNCGDWPPRAVLSLPDKRELIPRYAGPLPQTYAYKYPDTSWKGLSRLRRNELLVNEHDPVWANTGFHHQREILEECARAIDVPLLHIFHKGELKFYYNSTFYSSTYWLLQFDKASDAVMFKLKWPGTIIGANK